jgi:hypothetical protein
MIRAGLLAALLAAVAAGGGVRDVASPRLPEEPNPKEPAEPPEPREVARGGWAWKSDGALGMTGATSMRYQWPKAVRYDGKRERTFIAYAGGDSHPTLIFYDHALQYWSNPFRIAISPIEDTFRVNPALTVGPEGHIYCFYGANKSEQRMRRSLNPENPVRWGLVQNPCDLSSYPQAFFSGQTLFMFHRHGPGNKTWGVHASSDGGESWSPYAPWLDFEFEQIWEGPEVVLYTEGKRNPPRIHLAWIVYERDPPTWRDVYYAYTDDLGRSWRGAGGNLLAGQPVEAPPAGDESPWRFAARYAAAWAKTPPAPLGRGQGQQVFEGPTHGLVNDIVVDAAGRPALLFTTGGRGLKEDNEAWSAYWTGAEWLTSRITPVTSRFCRGCLSARGESVLRALIPDGSLKGGDMLVWDSYDGGGAWRLTYNLTKDIVAFHRAPSRIVNGAPYAQFIWSASYGAGPATIYVWGEESLPAR